MDVLAQQIVSEVAAQDWDEQGLFECLRRAWPYREPSRATFNQVVQILVDGFSTRVGRRAAYLHRDRINGRLRTIMIPVRASRRDAAIHGLSRPTGNGGHPPPPDNCLRGLLMRFAPPRDAIL